MDSIQNPSTDEVTFASMINARKQDSDAAGKILPHFVLPLQQQSSLFVVSGDGKQSERPRRSGDTQQECYGTAQWGHLAWLHRRNHLGAKLDWEDTVCPAEGCECRWRKTRLAFLPHFLHAVSLHWEPLFFFFLKRRGEEAGCGDLARYSCCVLQLLSSDCDYEILIKEVGTNIKPTAAVTEREQLPN